MLYKLQILLHFMKNCKLNLLPLSLNVHFSNLLAIVFLIFLVVTKAANVAKEAKEAMKVPHLMHSLSPLQTHLLFTSTSLTSKVTQASSITNSFIPSCDTFSNYYIQPSYSVSLCYFFH